MGPNQSVWPGFPKVKIESGLKLLQHQISHVSVEFVKYGETVAKIILCKKCY
jgi:hypothetical protein